MKYTQLEQRLSTASLLDAVRRGQVFGIEIVPLSASMTSWRIYIEVITKGLGLHKVALEDQGRVDLRQKPRLFRRY